jgi:hypothetical protein
MPSIADAKVFQVEAAERLKKAKEIIRKYNQEWIYEYIEQLFQRDHRYVFHGTHLSNVTGIRLGGLRPLSEENKHLTEIFTVINPISAASHVLQGGQTDTYKDKPSYPYKDQDLRLKNDPFILLKIDAESLNHEIGLDDYVYESIQRGWTDAENTNALGDIKLDRRGIIMDIDSIPAKYIKAVIHDKQGKIHELSLDDLMERVLLKNELGIYPDFMEEDIVSGN